MIISIGNRKGGTGKTTTVVNLAKALVDLGKDVLVLDMDPQANLSYSLGVAVEGCLLGEVLLESKIEDEYIFNSGGIDIIPSNESLQEYELEMIRSDYSKFCLQKALNERHSDYDLNSIVSNFVIHFFRHALFNYQISFCILCRITDQ